MKCTNFIFLKGINRVISLFVILCLVFSLLGVQYVNAEVETIVEIGDVSGTPGSTTMVPITFTSVPSNGIYNLSLWINLNSDVSIENITIGDIVTNKNDVTINNSGKGYVAISFLASSNSNIVKDGVFGYMNVKIPENASSGSKYELTINKAKSGLFDENYNTINASFNIGSLSIPSAATPTSTNVSTSTPTPTIVSTSTPTQKVTPTTSSTEVEFSLGKVTGNPGSVIDVPVELKNVPSSGISSLSLWVEYNTNEISVDGVKSGNLVLDLSKDNYNINSQKGYVAISYLAEEAPISGNGIFAYIQVKILQDVAAGSVSNLKIYKSKSGTFDENYNSISTVYSNGVVNVNQNILTITPTVTTASSKLEVSLGKVSGDPGSVVNVPLELKNVSSAKIASLSLWIEYNTNEISVEDVKVGNIVSTLSKDDYNINSQKGYVAISYLAGETYLAKDGVLAYLQVVVPKSGLVSNLKVNSSKTGIFDEDYKSIFATYVDGNVSGNTATITPTLTTTITPTITPTKVVTPTVTTEPSELEVSLGKVSGNPGSVINVPVELKNVPSTGINSLSLWIEYSANKISVEDVIVGNLVSDLSKDNYNINSTKGYIALSYLADGAGITQDGIFGYIQVRIPPDATKASNLNIKESSSGLYDENYKSIPASYTNGSVDVVSVTVTTTPIPTNTTKLEVSLGKVTGKPGSVVEVPIELKGTEGKDIYGLTCWITYNKNEIVVNDVKNGDVVSNLSSDIINNNKAGGFLAISYVSDANTRVTKDGIFAYLQVRISDSVTNGSSSDLIINTLKSGAFNGKYGDVNTTFSNGNITVDGIDKVEVSIGNVSASKGQTVIVPITIKGIPTTGIYNSSFSINYDKTLIEVTKINVGSVISNSNDVTINNVAGKIGLTYLASSDGSSTIKDEGVFANLEVKILDGANIGDICNILFNEKKCGVFNQNYNEILAAYSQGSVLVK